MRVFFLDLLFRISFFHFLFYIFKPVVQKKKKSLKNNSPSSTQKKSVIPFVSQKKEKKWVVQIVP
jgi:hypothetical protein